MKNKIIKKSSSMLAVIMVLMMVVAFMPKAVFSATHEVTSFAELKTAVETTAVSGDTIEVKNNITMTDEVTIPDGKALTIKSNPSSTLTRGASNEYSLFSVSDSGTLTLESIIIDGGGRNVGTALIDNSGAMNLGNGAVLKNNFYYPPAFRGAGGVINYGTLNVLAGSEISGCSSSYTGGGIYNESGTVNMSGGTIKNNKGDSGGVYNLGTFIMTGGTITGNTDALGNEDAGSSGIMNEVSLTLSGNVNISPNKVKSGSPIKISGALSGSVAVYPPYNALDGTIIASGDNYTLTESDKDVFSVEGYEVSLDSNNVVLNKKSVSVTGVSLNKSKAEILVGKTLKLKATVTPSDANNKNVVWTSSNENIAAVDTKGNIKAKKAGKAIITVTTKDGNYKDTCSVTVKENTNSSSGNTGGNGNNNGGNNSGKTKNPNSAKTGDSNNMLLWGMVMLSAMFAGGGLILKQKISSK